MDGNQGVRVAVAGCAGRMGRMIITRVLETAGCRLAAGVDRPGSPALGTDLGVLAGQGPVGVAASADLDAALATADVLIDFTTAGAPARHAAAAAAHGTALVIGTTGLEAADQQAIDAAAARVAVVQAANMSVGVNLLLGVVERVARALDDGYDIEIVEMHHRHKVDAPSGTALALGRAAAAGRGRNLDEVAVRARDGHTGARRSGDIGFAVLRGGDVVGEHSVVFAGTGERITLGHIAGGRQIFAAGAVRAALWTADKPPGRYGMADVLGL